jgi:psp operon transcriptional activator
MAALSALPPGDFVERVRGYEAKLLSEALAASQFNQRRTAQALGLTYHQLRHHLKKHGLLGAR